MRKLKLGQVRKRIDLIKHVQIYLGGGELIKFLEEKKMYIVRGNL